MPFVSQFGLKGRAITFCVVLLLGTVGALCTVLSWRYYDSSVTWLTRHALMNARSIAFSAEPYVLLNDRKALERVVHTAESNAAIQQATIVDTKGETLAMYARSGSPAAKADLSFANRLTAHWNRETHLLELTGGECLVAVPVFSDTSGLDIGLMEDEKESAWTDTPVAYVTLTYSLGQVEAEVARSILSSVAISLVIVGIGIVVTIFVIRQFLTPINDLLATATSISAGDLSDRASENAVGEVGDLARAFNHMARTLEEHAQNLETLVRERTEALEKSEAYMRAIVDTAADGVITIDEAGLIESFNAAAERVFGYQAPEVIGHNVSMLMPEPYSHEHSSFIARYLRTGEPHVVGAAAEVRGRRKDGTVFAMDIAVSEVKLADRRMFTGIVRDTTDRKLAEEEQQKLVSLIDNSRDFIAMMSLDGKLMYLNPAGRHMIGIADGESVSSLPLGECHSHETAEQLQGAILPELLKSGHWEGEGQIRNLKTEALTDAEISAFLIRHPKTDEPICVATIERDVTDRKRWEARQRRNLEELEKFNQLAVGRELRMVELKREINALAKLAGVHTPYDLSFVDSSQR